MDSWSWMVFIYLLSAYWVLILKTSSIKSVLRLTDTSRRYWNRCRICKCIKSIFPRILNRLNRYFRSKRQTLKRWMNFKSILLSRKMQVSWQRGDSSELISPLQPRRGRSFRGDSSEFFSPLLLMLINPRWSKWISPGNSETNHQVCCFAGKSEPTLTFYGMVECDSRWFRWRGQRARG